VRTCAPSSQPSSSASPSSSVHCAEAAAAVARFHPLALSLACAPLTARPPCFPAFPPLPRPLADDTSNNPGASSGCRRYLRQATCDARCVSHLCLPPCMLGRGRSLPWAEHHTSCTSHTTLLPCMHGHARATVLRQAACLMCASPARTVCTALEYGQPCVSAVLLQPLLFEALHPPPVLLALSA